MSFHGSPASLHRRGARVWLGALLALGVALLIGAVAGSARSASPSPGLIAFTRADGIYVMNADGSGIRALRRDPVAAGAIGLTWSPDGRKLAFTDMSRIWVMDADGTHLVCIDRLEDGRAGPGVPAWSPGGENIAFSASKQDPGSDAWRRDIWVVHADGSSARRLVKAAPGLNGVGDIAWSPSGRRIALTDSWLTSLYVMNVDGTHLRALTRAVSADTSPEWSPDGRRIAFAHGVPNTSYSEWEIWVVDPRNGSHHRLLRGSIEPAKYPTWSPDGRRIAFVRGDSEWARRANVPAPRRSPAEIYVMNADGTGLRRLTHNQLGEGSPAWQPSKT